MKHYVYATPAAAMQGLAQIRNSLEAVSKKVAKLTIKLSKCEDREVQQALSRELEIERNKEGAFRTDIADREASIYRGWEPPDPPDAERMMEIKRSG